VTWRDGPHQAALANDLADLDFEERGHGRAWGHAARSLGLRYPQIIRRVVGEKGGSIYRIVTGPARALAA
jgi:hypothetical protein